MIRKNHFALNKADYNKGLTTGFYNSVHPENLRVWKVENNYDILKPLMAELSKKWHWKDQPRYNEEALRAKLAEPDTELFVLVDGVKLIGYAMASRPPQELNNRFFMAANTSVIEIDNLGLFPKLEGGGRGKHYFEQLFERYFPNNDVVFWSQHETHSPTLRKFYQEKMGMELLGHDLVNDFRPQPKQKFA